MAKLPSIQAQSTKLSLMAREQRARALYLTMLDKIDFIYDLFLSPTHLFRSSCETHILHECTGKTECIGFRVISFPSKDTMSKYLRSGEKHSVALG